IAKMQPSFAAKNIRVQNNIPASLPLLMVDKQKFYRLFELLLKDETVSLPAGSEVTFTAEPSEASAGQPEAVRLQISDNGPGLPKEALRLIFDPFVVRSDSPLEYGINLMACYFIVHHHGGQIEAKNEEGQGTSVTLRLPINPNQPPQIEESQEF